MSTLYIASALEAVGAGQLTSVDNQSALQRKPSAAQLLAQAELSHRVELVYEQTSYNWFLYRKIREQTRDGSCEACFDFCFIDGAHTWEDDGLAFFLVDKLLRPGGWILFDDLSWSMDERWPNVPPEQRALRQIEEVFDLLVASHPSYRELKSDGDWGWARKAQVGEPPVRTVRRRDVKGAVGDIGKMVRGRLSR